MHVIICDSRGSRSRGPHLNQLNLIEVAMFGRKALAARGRGLSVRYRLISSSWLRLADWSWPGHLDTRLNREVGASIHNQNHQGGHGRRNHRLLRFPGRLLGGSVGRESPFGHMLGASKKHMSFLMLKTYFTRPVGQWFRTPTHHKFLLRRERRGVERTPSSGHIYTYRIRKGHRSEVAHGVSRVR